MRAQVRKMGMLSGIKLKTFHRRDAENAEKPGQKAISTNRSSDAYYLRLGIEANEHGVLCDLCVSAVNVFNVPTRAIRE